MSSSVTKAVAGRQVAFDVKIAGVDLRVGQLALAAPVKQHQGVARRAWPGFQQRDADGHLELSGKAAEGGDKFAVGRQRFGLPIGDRPVVDAVAVAPHLGEKGKIRPALLGAAAGGKADGQVFGG